MKETRNNTHAQLPPIYLLYVCVWVHAHSFMFHSTSVEVGGQCVGERSSSTIWASGVKLEIVRLVCQQVP